MRSNWRLRGHDFDNEILKVKRRKFQPDILLSIIVDLFL